jgi:type IV pilus assembly protein PilE
MRRVRGFTLLEMMIVLALIGILSAIALPQYNQYLLKTRLTEAFNQLSDYRVRLEQYYQDNRNYGPASSNCGVVMPTSPQVKYFSYTCTVDATQQQFLMTATSNAGAGMGAAGSFVYTINQSDVKATTAFTGASGLPKQCWITTASSSC